MSAHEKETGKVTSFRFPKGSCDTHCHVFGPSGKIHFPADGPYQPADSPKEALAALHRRLGIDRAVIVQASGKAEDSAAAQDAIADDPINRRGVTVIDKTCSKAQLLALHAAGFRGARFSFLKHMGGGPDPETFARVVELIEPLGWHLVLIMRSREDEGVLLGNAKRFSALTLPFVIDHMAGVNALRGIDQPAMQCLLELARKPNCWIKVAGGSRIAPPPFEASIPIAQAILAAAPDRCLWGTDFPHPYSEHCATDDELVDLIPRYAPDPDRQHRLLVANPARLYSFADAV